MEVVPVYDINPNPQSAGTLTTFISENDNSASIDLALEVAYYFDIKDDEANAIVKEMHLLIKDWETIAKSFGIKRSGIEQMRNAFNFAD